MKTNLKNAFRTIGLTLAAAAQANVVTVGNSNNCDYDLSQSTTLQDAIDATGVTEIRVSKDALLANGITINRPLVLTSGFDDCNDAAAGQLSQDPLPNATIDVAGSGRPVTIQNASSGVIEIKYFDLKNGDVGTTQSSHNGGGMYVNPNNQADVLLDHTRLFQNTAFGGGGIYFDGSTHQTKLTLKDSFVGFNLASNTANNGFNGGGGLFITGGSLLVYGETSVTRNDATSSAGFAVGGGIFASNTNINMIAGSDDIDNGITRNTAAYRGGGMYLGGDVNMHVYGRPVEIDGSLLGTPNSAYRFVANEASTEGGGAIFSVQSSVSLEQVEFNENIGGQLGGAIGLIESAVTINSRNEKACRFYPYGCNLFTFNQAPFGGAIWANVDSNIDIKKTIFTQNAADEGVSLNVGSTQAQLESVVFFLEGILTQGMDNNNVITSSDSDMLIKYATLVDNRTNQSIFNAVGSVSPTIDVVNSIAYNPAVPALGSQSGQGVNDFVCVLSDSPEGTGTISQTQYFNMFVNPGGGDFRLQPGAIAIDFCQGNGSATPTTTDYLGIERGYDDPATVNVGGTFDAGSHEFDDDLIFKSQFDFF